ncbi:hypothetical protein EDB87DRAFT_1650167, partial [Lactarius vividus]
MRYFANRMWEMICRFVVPVTYDHCIGWVIRYHNGATPFTAHHVLVLYVLYMHWCSVEQRRHIMRSNQRSFLSVTLR